MDQNKNENQSGCGCFGSFNTESSGKPPRKGWLKTGVFFIIIGAALVVAAMGYFRKSEVAAMDEKLVSNADMPCCVDGTNLDFVKANFKNIEFAYVILPGNDNSYVASVSGNVDKAVEVIQSSGVKAASYIVGEDSPDCGQLKMFFEVERTPVILALSKDMGCRIIDSDITQNALLQSYVLASKPASDGCAGGPDSGCE